MGRTARCAAIWLGLLALAGLGACGGSDTPTPAGATVPKATSTTSAADQYAVPATIDAAYLNRVFAALERIDGDATRLVVASKDFVPDAAKRLRAIYAEEEFQEQVKLWLDIVIKKQFDRFRAEPGDRSSLVDGLLTARADCVFVGVRRDYAAVAASAPPAGIEYVTLRPADGGRDPFELNPTPWMISSEGYKSDGSVPRNPCDS